MADYAVLGFCALFTAFLAYTFAISGYDTYLVLAVLALALTVFVGHGMWRDRR